MFSLLHHFTLPANWNELVCSNMNPGIYNTYTCVLLQEYGNLLESHIFISNISMFLI